MSQKRKSPDGKSYPKSKAVESESSDDSSSSSRPYVARCRLGLARISFLLLKILSTAIEIPTLMVRRAISPLVNSKAVLRLTHSVFLSTLIGVSFILLFTTFLTMFLSYTSFDPIPNLHYYDTHNSVSTYQSPSTKTLQSSLENRHLMRFVEDELEHSFSVPPSLSRKIPPTERYLILTKLQSLHVPHSQKSPRLFFLHAIGSSAESRLNAIASAMTYTVNTGRFLIVLWDTERGGVEGYGDTPLLDIQRGDQQKMVISFVKSLSLSPDTSHWTDYSITYLTKPPEETPPLDDVAKFATRHIFYRTENMVESKYATLLPGVTLIPKMLSPTASIQHEWNAYFKDWTYPSLDEASVGDVLNRVYGVPWIFLDGMTDGNRRLLLRQLNRSASKRALFVHVQYGMGNRLRVLGSAMAIADVTSRVLVLVWEPDVHLDCHFNDLFVNQFVIIEKLNLNWPPSGASVKDPAMRMVDFYNFMRNEGSGRHNPLKQLVDPRNGRHTYAKSAYVLRSSFTSRILSPNSKYWKIMRRELVPRVEVMLLVMDPMFTNIHKMVGVHIRGRTIENDIKGVGQEIYGSSSQITDHWRKRTGIKTFEKKIRKLNSTLSFFVAADMKESIDRLEKVFGPHRIFSLPRTTNCVSRDASCVKLALADILLLSRVPVLLGSHWSSFSEAALRFSGNMRVLLAGKHFG